VCIQQNVFCASLFSCFVGHRLCGCDLLMTHRLYSYVCLYRQVKGEILFLCGAMLSHVSHIYKSAEEWRKLQSLFR
jgi:hypothetical protein